MKPTTITYHSASGHHIALAVLPGQQNQAAEQIIEAWLRGELTYLECEEFMDRIERRMR